MKFNCPSCDEPLTISGPNAPRFCSHCGATISEEVRTQIGTETMDASDQQPDLSRLAPDATIAPQSINSPIVTPLGGDETVTHVPGLTQAGDASDVPGSSPIRAGRTVGPYRLVSQLGQGGMGTVFEAIHNQTGQRVALKLLSRSVKATEESVARFKRESQIAASINHPRSTFVYESGEHDGQLYVTMELMGGGTLTQIVEQEGKLPVGRAVDYVLDMIDGLNVAHQAGIVHRDIKPSNSFIDNDGRVKIGDFGLAKSFVADSSLTQTGMFMGTPQFAAPEQLRASEVDERADIYALGATLFYLITGRPVFTGGAAQVIAAIASDPPPKIESIESTVPRQLSQIIQKTLEKDPAKRPENLLELQAMLSPFSTRGASLADIGRRMAAFFLDLGLSGIIAGVFGSLFIAFVGMLAGAMSLGWSQLTLNFFTVGAQAGMGVLYFIFCEWKWGRTPGKMLLGMRVIAEDSATPSLVQATIRSTLIPGLSWVVNGMSVFMMDFGDTPNISLESLARFTLVTQGFTLAGWLSTAICLVTCRASNGYRGLHDILSKTRVVRLAGVLQTRRMENVPVTLPVADETGKKFAAYQPLGLLGSNNGSTIYLGKDDVLDRRVWVFENPNYELTNIRKSLSRPYRLRVLAESTDYPDQTFDQPWQVTEAVSGAPLHGLLVSRDCKWNSVRPLLQDLATELRIAVADSTLPDRLEMGQVWVDGAGRLKLLDQPLQDQDAETTGTKLDDQSRAIKFLAEVVGAYTDNNPAPLHVFNFKKELESAATGIDLKWARTQLVDFADRPSNWKWDDRLGSLAVSFGLELPLLTTIMMAIGALALTFWKDNPTGMMCFMTGLGCALTFLMGVASRGGPSLRFSRVQLCRNRSHQAASWFRCGFRTMIAWLPFVALAALTFGVILQLFVNVEVIPKQTSRPDVATSTILLAMIPALLLLGLGAVYAILSPRRGLPDLLSGTTLIRE